MCHSLLQLKHFCPACHDGFLTLHVYVQAAVAVANPLPFFFLSAVDCLPGIIRLYYFIGIVVTCGQVAAVLFSVCRDTVIGAYSVLFPSDESRKSALKDSFSCESMDSKLEKDHTSLLICSAMSATPSYFKMSKLFKMPNLFLILLPA